MFLFFRYNSLLKLPNTKWTRKYYGSEKAVG